MLEAAAAGPAPIPIVASIAPLAEGREAWLVDVWGVVHNGVEPFAAACDACARYRLSGGLVLLVSNAPRPAASVAAQLDRIGVPRFAWDAIVTSGDVARALVGAYRGRNVFHLGPERDLSLYDDLGVVLSSVEAAEAVSCTGLFDDDIETPDDYRDMLAAFAERKLPMICANPDLTVERGTKLVYCAGALAELYRELGGGVEYAGKPFLPIYAMAMDMLAKLKKRTTEKAKVLAIGDGLRTDIAGAAGAGIQSVFIASGIHVAGGRIDEGTLATLFAGTAADTAVRPIAAMPALAW